MDIQLVLIADPNAKNLQILKDNLKASGFLITTVTNGKEAWEEIQRTAPKLVLSETNLPGLSGFQLLERINSDPKTSSIPLIFLTKQREIQQRIKSFEMGAKDYLLKPLHVKEVIAHIRMVLRRIERRKINQIETYKKFSGRLYQLSLADLIESFGVERKTGILTVSNGRRTGQVYFREGSVVNASLDDFKTEQAIYQMLPWERGYFNMIFRDVDVAEKISISNLGLLLQGIKRLEIREKLIKELPSPKTVFTVSPTFKNFVQNKKVGNGASEFIALLDGNRNLEHIVDESKLDDLIAIKRLVRLYQQGFIKPTIASEKKPVTHPNFIEPEKKVKFINKLVTPQKIELENENINHQLESTNSDEYMFQEHSAKQAEPIQKLEPPENENYTPAFDEKKSTKSNFETESTLQPTLESEDINKSEDQPSSLFNGSKEDNVFALKPAQPLQVEKEIKISDEEQILIPVDEKKSEIDDFKTIQNSASKTEIPEIKHQTPSAEEKVSGDNVFEIKPKKSPEDLEKEIKPIIERIEQGNKSFQEKDEKIDKPEPALDKKESVINESEIINKSISVRRNIFNDLKIKESDQIFIDEELLKQSSLQLKQEQSESEKIMDVPAPKHFIEPVIPVVSVPSPEQNKIVLISIDNDCKDEIMDILTNDNFKSIEISEADNLKIDLGKINLNAYSRFSLVAISVEKNLNSFLKSIKYSVAGNIFAFDCTRPETWEYTSYLIHSIWFKFRIPYVIAVMNFKEQNSITMDVIRYKLDLDKNITMVTWNEVDKTAPDKLLGAIIKSTNPEPLNAAKA